MDFSAWMGIKPTKRQPDENELSPGELLEAGVNIPKGDPRLIDGLDRSKLYPHEKTKLLKIVASNYILEGEKLVPTYEKPFNWIVEGSHSQNWLPELDSN